MEIFEEDIWNPEISEMLELIEDLNPRKPADLRTLLVFSYTIGASLERWNIAQYPALTATIESAGFAGFNSDEVRRHIRQQLVSGVEGLPNRAWQLTDPAADVGMGDDVDDKIEF